MSRERLLRLSQDLYATADLLAPKPEDPYGMALNLISAYVRLAAAKAKETASRMPEDATHEGIHK